MKAQKYGLRLHHLVRLIDSYKSGYDISRPDRPSYGAESGETKTGADSSQDDIVFNNLQAEISSNPANMVRILDGIDSMCKVCSNYNPSQNKCNKFPVELLRIEDNRSQRIVRKLGFRAKGIRRGKTVKVADLFSLGDALSKYRDQMNPGTPSGNSE